MTQQELLERSIQKLKDGSDYLTIRNFLKYQNADDQMIREIMNALRAEEAKGNLVNETQMKEAKKNILADGFFSLIMGLVVLGFGLFMFFMGFIGVLIITMIVGGALMSLKGLIQILIKK